MLRTGKAPVSLDCVCAQRVWLLTCNCRKCIVTVLRDLLLPLVAQTNMDVAAFKNLCVALECFAVSRYLIIQEVNSVCHTESEIPGAVATHWLSPTSPRLSPS